MTLVSVSVCVTRRISHTLILFYSWQACGVSSSTLSDTFTAIALAEIVLVAYTVSNEFEQVERTIKAIVHLAHLKQDILGSLTTSTGLFDKELFTWTQFFANFSSSLRTERVQVEGWSLSTLFHFFPGKAR